MKEELCPSSKKDPNDNKMLRAFASTNKMITDEVKKLIITKRSDFPTKGLPRTLQELQIIGVGCIQMPIGILNLVNLTSLDLSNNQITKIHKSLGNLRLKQLIIADNKLSECSWTDWQWMNGKNLQTSLQLLNLSKNKLSAIPNTITCFEKLVTLDLSSNEIKRIPFAIQQLKQLRKLNLSKNGMENLPCTFSKLILDDIDLSQNNFSFSQDVVTNFRSLRNRTFSLDHKSPTLFELSARIILNKKIPYIYQNIPKIIKDILFFSPTCSRCSNFCFDRKIYSFAATIEIRSKNITSDHIQKEFYVYGPICSQGCLSATN